MSNLDWFVHDRFGLFIHWGIYAAAARHEWVKNRERITDERLPAATSTTSTPTCTTPRQWARDAKAAGMKIRRDHHQAPRRLLPLGLGADRLQGDQHPGRPRPARARWSRPSAPKG